MAAIGIEIQTFDEWGDGHHAQARYCVQGYDDIYWCDTVDDALRCARNDLARELHGEFERG